MVTMTEEDDEHMSDNDIPENVHNRLLGAISHLYKQKRVKASHRKEYSLKVSEFHLTKPDDKKKGKIEITHLAKLLNKRAGHVKFNEQIKSSKRKSKKLPKPLEKPQAEKIQRTVGYENVKQDLSQWDAVVYHQRVAEHVSFPLKEPKMQIHKDPNNFLTTFKTPTELELKLAETLNSSELYRKEKEEEQEQEDFPLSLEEIKEQRSIMARLRAQLSYKEAKAARQNRIKSKKFHRIQRKDKIKTQIKEFEELQKSDPEAALKKLEQLEKARAQERASLRHRTTGQWARNLAVRAKYNKEARIALSEQLSQSCELTQKLKPESSDEEKDNSSDDESKGIDKNDFDNSWLNKEPVSEVQEFYGNYKKYEKEETRKKETNKSKFVTPNDKIKSPQNIDSNDDCCGNVDETFEINHGSLNVVKKNTNVSSIRRNSNKKNNNNKGLENHEPAINFTVTNSPLDSKNKQTEKCVLENKPKNYIKDSVVEVKFSVLKRSPQTYSSSSAVEDSVKKGHITEKKQMKRKLPTKSGIWSVTSLKKNSNLKTAKEDKMKCMKICNEPSDKNDAKLSKSRANSKLSLDDMFYEAEERLNEVVTKKVKKLKQSLETKNSESKIEVVHLDNDSEYNNNNSGLEMKKQTLQTEVDERLGETSNSFQLEKENIMSEAVQRYSSLSKNLDLEKYNKSLNIEPNNFLHAKPKRLITEVPNSFASAEDNLDDLEDESKVEEKSMTISEAFACDDVEEEFKQDKEEEIKKSQVEDVNLVLPGWGSWGGPNVNNVPKHKSKKFILKFPKEIPRKDENKGNVVINEDRDEKLKPYLVTELPFPFTSVKEYEASIRAPVGNTWMPQSAHRKLIAPSVTTKLGTIIEPMTKDQILKNKEN